jgi:hypothetical protein
VKICPQLYFLNVFRIAENLHIIDEEPHFCIIFYQHCFQILFCMHLTDFIFVDFIHNLDFILLYSFDNFLYKVMMDGHIAGCQSLY